MKGPEFACKCHQSQQGVSFVSSRAATGNTEEKCYETFHTFKFSLGLLHLAKGLAVQCQQEMPTGETQDQGVESFQK